MRTSGIGRGPRGKRLDGGALARLQVNRLRASF
jgi:hypothetical protein